MVHGSLRQSLHQFVKSLVTHELEVREYFFCVKKRGTLIEAIWEDINRLVYNILKPFQSFFFLRAPFPLSNIGEDVGFKPLVTGIDILSSNKVLSPLVPPLIEGF